MLIVIFIILVLLLILLFFSSSIEWNIKVEYFDCVKWIVWLFIIVFVGVIFLFMFFNLFLKNNDIYFEGFY